MKQQNGFTLVELMIVLIIIGILAGFAVPSYLESVMRGSRGEGMTAMLDIMRAQEDYFANNYTYTTNLTDLDYSATVVTDGGRYAITAQNCTGELISACVELKATAQNGQQTDGNLILDSIGNRKRGSISSWSN
mgnify:CR=1 FL=1